MSFVVSQLFRYPVKSMGGHSLSRVTMGTTGLPGDRCWTLQDAVRQDLKVGKRNPALMGMNARLLAEPSVEHLSPHVEIDLGNGRQVTSDDPNIDATMSQALGQAVRLWPLLPKEQLDHYRRKPSLEAKKSTDGDAEENMEAALRQVFARTADEPLPDLSVFPAELFEYESPPGTYFDAFPLLIVANTSLASLAKTHPNANFDVRRFRPNIIVDTPPEAFIENDWVDKRAKIGGCLLQLHMPCPRCIMTTHGFADLPKDPTIMRTLVAENDGNLGIYASVIEPGDVALGDQLELLD